MTRLRGYRGTDRELLAGPWLPGELLGLPVAGRPPLAEPAAVAEPDGTEGGRDELCIVPDTGFVRWTDIDWVNRRACLEIGLHRRPDDLPGLLAAAVEHGFHGLNLHRLYGWVTPAAQPPAAALAACGFRREAVAPEGMWFDGRAVDREIWGAVRRD
ncbi:GNAT family N-acetyltransferase [Streptomyces sp. YIM 98790]|uniref:GNAT family N-acetyltransferase n=1 Tax=Streptomyces sp. YIM 98790 TaxID=2689077 RepID=UPI001408171F|nr:GNAT family protein [Streptomyces sp. YIM 98790]